MQAISGPANTLFLQQDIQHHKEIEVDLQKRGVYHT